MEEGENQFQGSGDRREAKKIEHVFFILSSASLVLFSTRAEIHLLILSLK